MQYNALRSIVGSRKNPVSLQAPTDSFFVRTTRVEPYIEPSFSKVEFPKEKPAILLVSAVGASGKTTAAHALSFDIQLPILDLAKHKAVGDNTLTGILTSAYPIGKVGAVLEGLRNGTHGIIIDGIDEGKSKTTEQGFEAFLDDLIQRAKGASGTAIVILGRSQVLFTTWVYLADKGADVGMVQIDPFNLEQAKTYIDSRVTQRTAGQKDAYEQVRDGLLAKLNAAFTPAAAHGQNAFLSFIGYPPVLDAVATLLQKERNYHRVNQALTDGTGGQLEIDLLIRISDYLLDRDHDEKALPNFIDGIATEVGGAQGQALRKSLYNREEQCARVLARALARPFPKQVLADNALNEKYEAALANWLPEHPFLDDTRLRNVVFAGFAVARCALSDVPEYQALGYDYAAANRPTYHLLYIVAELVKGRPISMRAFNMLIQSCSEFLGISAEIAVDIDGESWEEPEPRNETRSELVIAIGFPEKNQERRFVFSGVLDSGSIPLGPYILNATVTLPCQIDLSGAPAIEAIGECSISARRIRIDSGELILRSSHRQTSEDSVSSGLLINAEEAEGHVNGVSVGTSRLEIQCVEHALDYPLAKYVQRIAPPPADPALRAKYRKLRRILSQFRSHKKGNLAKFRAKIENERIAGNPLGKKILTALLEEHVLWSDQKFYYVDAAQCDAKLGISWQQLRQYRSSAKLEGFLKRIPN